MVLILDANEYIFAFGAFRKESCEKLIKVIRDKHPKHIIRITRLIVNEVRDNLPPEAFKEFILFLNALTIAIDEDIVVPFELGAKYEAKGFKPADAFICAYVEYVKADALVTENRHFLTKQELLPFKVISAEECLSIIK